MTLQGKTAVVTGASRGIGRAAAAALASAGAPVLVHYGRSAREAESLVSEIQAKGGRANAISAALGIPDGAGLLAKQVRSIVADHLDVLVLNAGISRAALTADHTVEDFNNLFAANVRGPFFLVPQMLPILGEGSSIIVISSIAAHAVVGTPSLDNPSILAYASTKGSTRDFGQELGCHSWTARHPRKCSRTRSSRYGYVDFLRRQKTEAGREVTLGMQALQRIGKPEDIDDEVAFLASDAARWITGADIPVDGRSKL